MTSLADYNTNEPIKALFIGDSGSGKTGALASLVCAGYKVRVLDFDKGVASLRTFVVQDCKDKLNNVDYHSFRDEFILKGGKFRCKDAKALQNAMKKLDHWNDDDPEDKLENWGTDTVFVIDSLTHLSRAAFNWAEALNPGVKDRRQIYGAAQEIIEHLIANVTGDAVGCHVIVISHVEYVELEEGITKGFARAIGKSLSPKIPTYFNYQLLAQTSGSGSKVTRTIRTVPTAVIDAKAPPTVPAKLDLATGLAEFFEAVQS